MCDALHAMTCLNQCDVMSLLEGFFSGSGYCIVCYDCLGHFVRYSLPAEPDPLRFYDP